MATILAGSYGAVPVSPAQASQVGGMTYRPQGPSGIAEDVSGGGNEAAPLTSTHFDGCPVPNKTNDECLAKPMPLTGMCFWHSQKVAASLQSLLAPSSLTSH